MSYYLNYFLHSIDFLPSVFSFGISLTLYFLTVFFLLFFIILLVVYSFIPVRMHSYYSYIVYTLKASACLKHQEILICEIMCVYLSLYGYSFSPLWCIYNRIKSSSCHFYLSSNPNTSVIIGNL